MHVLNEANTREARGLTKYNAVDTQGNNAIIGRMDSGVGRGYSPNRADPSNPRYNDKLDGWTVRIDPNTGEPFTAYPTK